MSDAHLNDGVLILRFTQLQKRANELGLFLEVKETHWLSRGTSARITVGNRSPRIELGGFGRIMELESWLDGFEAGMRIAYHPEEFGRKKQ